MRIAARGNLRAYAIHLVPKHDAHRKSRRPIEQIHRMHRSLDGRQFASPGANRVEQRRRVPGEFPRHGLIGAERGLGNRAFRRMPGDAAEVEFFDGGRVARAKERADVIQAADIVQQDRNRQ